MKNNKIICWWSGGITSAVACKLAIDLYGRDNCEVIFIDTMNEHDDTYRFMDDCSSWYGLKIKTITELGKKYTSIEHVWYSFNSLNTANGAICSSTLKKKARERWQKTNDFKHQVFGFEFETREFKRAQSLSVNYPECKPIFPLIMYGMTKQDCVDYANKHEIKVPEAYKLGLNNNNCLKTGCVQGGIGYWQLMHKIMPDQYEKMAKVEHDLTNSKGQPVTMLKDQSKESVELAKKLGYKRKYMPLFLKKHPDYPEIQTVLDKKAKEPEPLKDCNGFCGIDDLASKNKTRLELNDVSEL